VPQFFSGAEQLFGVLACGLYIWEFLTHLGYEWSVIQGRRPYRWTIWIYSADRLSTLAAAISYIMFLIISIPINCKVLTILEFTFAYMTFSFSSLLIVIRVIAIWNKNKFVVAFAVALWLTNASFFIYGITQIRAGWVPQYISCDTPNIQSNKLAITAMPVTDIALLVIMLIGLLRIRHRGGGRLDLGRLLWKQGVIYLFVATIAEIPPAVFLLLDLNIGLDYMFLMPSLIAMSIAATRMYRSLADFGFSADIGNSSDNPSKCIIGDTKWNTAIPLSPTRMEVTMHTSYDKWQSSTLQTSQYVPFMASDGQYGDKPRGVNLNDDVENSATQEK